MIDGFTYIYYFVASYIFSLWFDSFLWCCFVLLLGEIVFLFLSFLFLATSKFSLAKCHSLVVLLLLLLLLLLLFWTGSFSPKTEIYQVSSASLDSSKYYNRFKQFYGLDSIPLISSFLILFGVVLRALNSTRITVTFMFNNCSALRKNTRIYLSYTFFYFHFVVLWNGKILLITSLFFSVINTSFEWVFKEGVSNPFVTESHRESYVSHWRTDSGLCIYN